MVSMARCDVSTINCGAVILLNTAPLSPLPSRRSELSSAPTLAGQPSLAVTACCSYLKRKKKSPRKAHVCRCKSGPPLQQLCFCSWKYGKELGLQRPNQLCSDRTATRFCRSMRNLQQICSVKAALGIKASSLLICSRKYLSMGKRKKKTGGSFVATKWILLPPQSCFRSLWLQKQSCSFAKCTFAAAMAYLKSSANGAQCSGKPLQLQFSTCGSESQ